MEIIRRVHGDHEGISRVSGGLGGSKGMRETRNTRPNVGQGSGIQGDSGGFSECGGGSGVSRCDE